MYDAKHPLNYVSWSNLRPQWLALTMENQLQIIRL
jgi:hypothetical protein